MRLFTSVLDDMGGSVLSSGGTQDASLSSLCLGVMGSSPGGGEKGGEEPPKISLGQGTVPGHVARHRAPHVVQHAGEEPRVGR